MPNKVTRIARVCKCGVAFLTLLRRPATECPDCRKITKNREYKKRHGNDPAWRKRQVENQKRWVLKHGRRSDRIWRLKRSFDFHLKRIMEIQSEIKELEGQNA